ncbi:unnamed protein product [Durusdinium trenchii]|uniref:Uncharacterized protein n=2 Tax=Durusdinium trenchii TaxID=1381693 RepID=A0ABP0RP12_9DINO
MRTRLHRVVAELAPDRPNDHDKAGAAESGQTSDRLVSDTESQEEMECHVRVIDPGEPDVYLDALWGPLYFRMERIQKEGDASARVSDYWLVGLFLLLNLALQLAISIKIDQVGLETYGDLGNTLMNDACWRVSQHQQYVGSLYPSDIEGLNDATNFDFDCVPPILTLSMFPDHLDTNKDGLWSTQECAALEAKLNTMGSDMAKNMTHVLKRMAIFDQEKRPGSKSSSNGTVSFLDLEFFKTFHGRIQACLPVDPNLCGNLEVRGKLFGMLPWLDTAHQRVEECRNQFESFCSKIFGKDYDWIHYQTSKHCGEAEFARTYEVNVAEYETVQIYKGEDDSILGPAFVSFLVLLLFIWLMLMLSEFRAIYNFLYVVWYTPSTSNVDPSFASMENDKLVIHYLPISHKLFALIGILLPRFIIGCVILTVGTRFLTATNNLQDLVLNSTALGFLIEVDNMIHTSLLGDGFEKHVMNRSEQIEVQSGIRGQHEPYGALLLALLCTAGYTYYAYYNPYGLKAVGQGIECLCHLEGNCFARKLIAEPAL